MESDDQQDLRKLNAFHIAMYFDRMDLINYFITVMNINLMNAIRDPLTGSKVKFLI